MQADLFPSPKLSLGEIGKKHRALKDEYTKVLEQFGGLLKEAVDAPNELQKELADQFEKAKRRSKITSQITIYFYVIGSILVLVGTALDKLV